MTGRILIVDSVPTNRIVLRVKLSTAFYDVAQAGSAEAGLAAIRRLRPDLVIVANTLPDMTGTAFCATLRNHPLAARLPLLMVLDRDDPADRLAALAAGADDVLPRPLDDLVLLARLRSLLRARDAEAELELREDTRRALGLGEAPAAFAAPARVALVGARQARGLDGVALDLRKALGHRVDHIAIEDALRERDKPHDVIVLVEGPGETSEALSLLPQLRSAKRSRHAAIVYVAQATQRAQATAALDMGASDLLSAGPQIAELALRIRRQAARKQTADRLRANMRDGLRAAVIDPLTGLYNRRYVLPHLERVAERADRRNRPYALLLADLDHFKRVNDTYGHAAGDAVLVAVADRLRDGLRAADLVSRHGGEEFLMVMPDTNPHEAAAVADRLVRSMARNPVVLPDGTSIRITLSIGAVVRGRGDTAAPQALIDMADRALYRAKGAGRNCLVVCDVAGTPLSALGLDEAAPLAAPTAADDAVRQASQR